MQTYLPYADFEKTAKCLDNRRLGCQRKECLQILQTLQIGPLRVCRKCEGSGYSHNYKTLPSGYLHREWCKCQYTKHPYKEKTPWYNHPAVQMWKGYECRLFDYMSKICKEWRNRGFLDNCCLKAIELLNRNTEFGKHSMGLTPNWLGNEKVHVAYRSNLLRKNANHYRQFWPNEPDNLPYYWPTKNIDNPQ